jgi:glycosyltransferase involved in cell wall biosynthesis
MACGTPVVATPNAGAMEVLGEGEFGVITHPDQLAESLISLLTDADKRQYYSRLGLSRVREYDILNIANSYIKLVRDFRQ